MAGYNFIVDTGTVIVDTASLQTDVENEFKTALGANINLASSTPQGTLAASEVTARSSVMRNNADLANQINPVLSGGVYLDAICALMGIERGVNQSTVVTGVQFSGIATTTTIPSGSRVETGNGDIFVTVDTITIGSGGTTTGSIQSQVFGSIAAPLGALTILDGTVGWNGATVLSTSVVIPGTTALQDPPLKNQRSQQLALQGVGSIDAIRAAVLNVTNVTSCSAVDNYTGIVGTVNGIAFTLANANWVCVDGGANADIAAAMYGSRNSGMPWDFGGSGMGTPVNSPNGITVNDPVNPNLQYNVKFVRPIYYDVYAYISVHQAGISYDPTVSVQNAITNYTSGQESGEVGLIVGANISAFEYAGAVARQLPGLYVKNCLIAVVAQGAPAPIYPTRFVTEYIMPQYGRGLQAAGNIQVVIV